MVCNTDYLLLFFYHLCRRLPNSQLFYSVYTIAKYTSIILITHNIKGLETNLLTLPNIFLPLTFFGKEYKTFLPYYNTITSIVFILLLLFILFICLTLILFRLHFNSKLHNEHSSNTHQLTLWQSVSIRIIAIIWTIISLFSQHLIELYSFSIIHIAYPFVHKDIFADNYLIFEISIISILLCLICSYLFYYFSKSFSSYGDIGDKNLVINHFNQIIFTLCTSCQGIFTILNHSDNAIQMHHILNFIFLFLLLIQCVFGFREYNHYDSNAALFIEKILLYWSLISSLDELVIYFTCDKPFIQSYSLCKIVLEIGNGIILAKCNIIYIKRLYLNRFKAKIFNDKTHFDHNELLTYQSIVYEYKQKRLPFNYLYRLFIDHKESCAYKNCICNRVSIDRWTTQIQESNNKCNAIGNNNRNDNDINSSGNDNSNGDEPVQAAITEEQIAVESFEDFIIIGEYEITKALSREHKQRDNKHLEEELLINLHIDYILHIQKDARRALYFSSQYLILYQHRLSFINSLYLLEYKSEAYLKLTTEKIKGEHKELGQKTLMQKENKEMIFDQPMKLFEFTLSLQQITRLLIKCTDYLSKIYDFRRNIEVEVSKSSSASFSSSMMNNETFISFCKKYKKNHIELCDMMTNKMSHLNNNHNSNTNKKFKHYETCYMLTLYFKSSMHSIPKQFSKIFKILPSYDFFTERQGRINSYKDFNVMNPLLLFIDKKDDFIIKYISISLCNELKYNYQSIINTSFDQMLPSETVLLHKVLLKKFFLTSNTTYKSNKFILDNKKNFIPCYLKAKPFPTLQLNFGISISIEFTNQPKTSEKDYYLLLDHHWLILFTNKEFSEEFFFTLPMLNLLKMSFASFFGVNMDRIKSKAKTMFVPHGSRSRKEKGKAKPVITLEEDNHSLIPFSCGKQDSLFKDRKPNDINGAFSQVKKWVSYGTISQGSLLKNIENINLMIDEMGLDIEWYTRVNCLKEKIIISGTSFSLSATYSITKIEKLIYTIVHLQEAINPTQTEAIQMIKDSIQKLDFFNNSNNNNVTKDSIQCDIRYDKEIIRKYKVKSKYSSIAIINNPNDVSVRGYDLASSKAKTQFINQTNQSIKQNVSPSSTSKKDPLTSTSVSGMPSQNSLLGLNKTNGALLNISSSMPKRSIFEKINMLDSTLATATAPTYDSRKLFLHQKLKISLSVISKVLCVCLLLLSLLSFVFNNSIRKLCQSLFSLNIYALFLKSDLDFSSLNVLTCCELSDQDQDTNSSQKQNLSSLNLITQRTQLSTKAEEIMNHFTLFSKSLNSIVNSALVNRIFTLINSNDVYTLMLKNYELTTRSSGIYDELLHIHYYLKQLSDFNSFQPSSCRFKELFLNRQYEHFTNMTPEPSFEETIVFYICTNILLAPRHKMEDLVKTTHELIVEYVNQCQLSILFYNMSILLLLIVISISFGVIINYDKDNIQILLNMIYTKQQLEDKYDNLLKAFRVILDSFSIESCIQYEKIAKHQAIPPLYSKTERRIRERKSLYNNLGSIRHHKGGKGGNSNMNNNNSNHNEDKRIRVKAFNSKITTPKLVQYAFSSIICSLFLVLLISIFNILFSKTFYYELISINVISMNFIDQLPKFSELYLFSKISIMFNDIYYQTTLPSDYGEVEYYNQFNINVNTSSNTMLNVLNESEYVFLFYQILLIKRNLDAFINQSNRKKNNKRLWRISQWNTLLNSKDGLCAYSGVGYNIYTQSKGSGNVDMHVMPVIASISDIGRQCREIGNGIGLNGVNDFLEFATKEMTSIYTDFASLDSEKRDPLSVLNLFLFKSFAQMIDETLKYVHNANIYYITTDLNGIFAIENVISFCFSLALVLVALSVFAYIHFFLFYKIEDKVEVLKFIQSILSG